MELHPLRFRSHRLRPMTAMSAMTRAVGDPPDGAVGDPRYLVHFSVDIAVALPQYLGYKAVRPLQVGAVTGNRAMDLKISKEEKYGYKEKGCQEEKEKVAE